nr:EGF domain containing protein [Haemonchus contortus]
MRQRPSLKKFIFLTVIFHIAATQTTSSSKGSSTNASKTTATEASSSSTPSTSSTEPGNTTGNEINVTTPMPLDHRKCGNLGDTEYCYYENTTEVCDICKGVICPSGKKCVKKEMMCASDCVCPNDVDIEDENGFCRNPCELQPCMHGGTCTADINVASRYRCACSNEFEGERCEMFHNFCLDPTPPFCPAGEYDCVMHGYRNYSCECADGFYLNVTGKNCVKVGEQVNITLIFKQTPYSEIFNNLTHPEAISARRVIQAAFDKVYSANLIKLVFNNFTQGSLVAHLQLMLKLNDTGSFRSNEKIFKQFLLDCDTSSTPCFGTLGNAYLPYDGWIAKDERCGNIVCPENTECRPIDGTPMRTECVCKKGFLAIGSTADDQGRVIHKCQDIDECEASPCETAAECLNTPGSFVCTRDPDNAECPNGTTVVVTGPFSYRCDCSWIYAGSNCRFPLTLILLILACLFLLTTIIAILFAVCQKRRNRTGTYQLYGAPAADGMSSTKTVQSSWT